MFVICCFAFLSFKSCCLSKQKKSTRIHRYSFLYRDNRMHIALQSAVLGNPNAKHFGTAIAPLAEKTILNRFLTGSCLLNLQILLSLKTKKSTHIHRYSFLYRDNRIWTCGLFVPNEARYQTALYPVTISYYNTK